jgi:hypothetical protein
MPFEAYSAYFRAEELGVLAAAYDAAWQDLWTERLTLGAEQTLVLKKNLAQIILASACNEPGMVSLHTVKSPSERLGRSLKAPVIGSSTPRSCSLVTGMFLGLGRLFGEVETPETAFQCAHLRVYYHPNSSGCTAMGADMTCRFAQSSSYRRSTHRSVRPLPKIGRPLSFRIRSSGW